MNLNIYIICVVAVALLAVPAVADNNTATIRGGVYSWDTFELLENSVVEVNSTPSQTMMAKYGVYSFNLEPGDYLITASYYENSTLLYSAEEPIEIKGNGSYSIDLFLVPVYSELMDTGSGNGINDSSTNVSANESGETNKESTFSTVYYLGAIILFFLVVGGYTLKHKGAEINKPEQKRMEKHEVNKLDKSRILEEKAESKAEKVSVPVSTPEFPAKIPAEVEPKTEVELPAKPIETRSPEELEFEVEEMAENGEREFIPETEPTAIEQDKDKETSDEEPVSEPESTKTSEPPVVKKNLPLPADLQEIMDIIRGQGGRITQKDLRSKLKYSEGKVSLMLADLERRELIEKFKRGRGNVIIIRDEEK
jgi:uncharacterized membrane protein